MNYSFIQQEYGVRPELLRDFRISGDSMVGTIRPGDRARTVLWDCKTQTTRRSAFFVARFPFYSAVFV